MSHPELNNPEQFRPRRTIAEIREELSDKADGRGLGIDPGIMEAVVAVQASGFNTRQSCEGHLDRGSAYPWIAISEPRPDDIDDDESGLTLQSWIESNRRLHPKMDALLKEYYENREPDAGGVRIDYIVNPDGQEMKLQPIPRPASADATPESLAHYQAMMDEFGAFLLERAEH